MGWNKELDFEKVYEKLRFSLTSKSEDNKHFAKKPVSLTKIAILFIALRNGARISEAIEGFNKFKETGNHEVEVRVEKRGYAKEKINGHYHNLKDADGNSYLANPIMRTLIISEEIRQELPMYRSSQENLSGFCKTHFGFNTHALRFCFITHMSKKGVPVQTIANITKHATLNMIQHYTEEYASKEVLRNGVL
jgi:integrase